MPNLAISAFTAPWHPSREAVVVQAAARNDKITTAILIVSPFF
jgi:hypothetical protein